jgi:hypothetical protein
MKCGNCGKEIPDIWLEGIGEPKCSGCGELLKKSSGITPVPVPQPGKYQMKSVSVEFASLVAAVGFVIVVGAFLKGILDEIGAKNIIQQQYYVLSLVGNLLFGIGFLLLAIFMVLCRIYKND